MSHLKQVLLTDTAYTAWASRQLLRACSSLAPEQLDRDLGAAHFSILRTFRHIYYAERAWLHRLVENALPPMVEIGDQRLFGDMPPEPALDELERKWPEVWQGYHSWLDSISDEALTAALSSRMPDGSMSHFKRWEIVVHAVNHSTLHRGQIMSMMRTLGVKPPNTDEIAFYLAR